jgi:DNA-binding beta-propeller fold protein YncE
MYSKSKWTIPERFHFLKSRTFALFCAILAVAVISNAGDKHTYLQVGKQPDGSFIVSTEQRVVAGSVAFNARPNDMAIHPTGSYVAVLNQRSILFISPQGILADSHTWLQSPAAYRGIAWSPDGNRLFASVANGYVQVLTFQTGKLILGPRIKVRPPSVMSNTRPGGMVVSRNGKRLFVVVMERNAVAEIDLDNYRWVREYRVQNLPFEVKLSKDERTLIVTNWGGRTARDDDERSNSGSAVVVVDPRGAASTGAVSLIDRSTGKTRTVPVGLHPTAIAVEGDRAYITNSASDSLSEISLKSSSLIRTLPLKWGQMHLFGSMPCALAVRNKTAYICNGGDNAICVMDLASGKVRGYLPAGYYPIAIALDPSGKKAYVLNTKGNGSVREITHNVPLNVHQFQGTVSIVDLTANLKVSTQIVAHNNGWNRDRSALNPNLAVYHGAIQHVLYIIKENRSYDEILGDMPQGNGDKRLCILGETLTPNQHALARQFTLFDNAYVSGTNSADGHQWCTQALANDYLEHFYSGYRTFSFDGSCAMALSSAGCLWDAALKKGLTIRDYGEFCSAKHAVFVPKVKSWKDLWDDRTSGRRAFKVRAGTDVRSLRPYIHPRVLCWPLLQSDQERADLFIEDYKKLGKAGKVPNLMILTLPCDHTEGRNPGYPQPQCMVADNDLALGRVVEAVSNSPHWKNTCIFVTEDDTQFGLDHVDGHRTVYYAISPYTRRRYVDHELCNTVSMVRSIELMLGISPMNRFDSLTPPLAECFSNTRDLSSYKVTPNRIALDIMNAPVRGLTGIDRYWTQQSMALDWDEADNADPEILSRVIWHSICGTATPFSDL